MMLPVTAKGNCAVAFLLSHTHVYFNSDNGEEASDGETLRNMSVEVENDEPDFAVVVTPPRKG